MIRRSLYRVLPALLALLLLTACGGGGGSSGSISTPVAVVNTQTASDGLTRYNLRRQQLGLSQLARNVALDDAAQRHSDYQVMNSEITHDQTPGRPGFTGVTVGDRIAAAGYQFTQPSYAYGEVISRTAGTSGTDAAEDLIAAIYHRFVVFEPMFKEVGVGASAASGGPTYFTTDFTANGLDSGLGSGNSVVYPFNNQTDVPTVFFSDNEVPDPVPGRNAVGYPISFHTDIRYAVTVTSFTVQPRGGADLAVRLLTSAVDAYTRDSVAAIVPLDPLVANTIYDVAFVGTADGVAVNRSWSFTTRP